MLGRVGPMSPAMVPYLAALAIVATTELLQLALPTMDGSKSVFHTKLHPTCFMGVAAPYATEEA